MLEIQLSQDKILNDKIEKFDQLGGYLKFKIFQLSGEVEYYNKHYEVAKNTLTEVAKDINQYFQKIAEENNTDRAIYFSMTHEFDKLQQSGKPISLEQFLGLHYDLEIGKVIVRGQTSAYLNSYFYFDSEEVAENQLDLNEISKNKNLNKTVGYTTGFADAFLEPPHSMRIGKSIFEFGNYFIEFCNLLFSDFSKLQIYQWSVDCSNYFDAGKEWWGSHFWTVYNPVKNIYIGILASTTD